MSGIRQRLERLEAKAAGLYKTLRLPDGRTVLYSGEAALEAMVAAARQGDHWLLPHMRRMDTTEGMPGLIRALEGSWERVNGGDGG